MVFSGVVDYHSVHLIRITIGIIVQSKPAPKTLHFLMPAIAPHAGPFRGARIWSLPSLPANACSTENNIPFPFFYSRGTWPNNSCEKSVDRLNKTRNLEVVSKRDPGYLFPSFLSFAKVMQCTEYSKIWLHLTFAALSLTFIRSHKAFRVFLADRVIIGLPCGQGQLSRIWKVQCDWLSLGKECCSRLSRRRLWEGTKSELP